MGDVRAANPDQLEQLADKLWTHEDAGAYGELTNLLSRARNLDASAELVRLQPLLEWLRDAAIQLREGARILRQDDADGPVYDPNAGNHPPLPGDSSGDGSGDGGGEGWEFEVTHQLTADQFIEVASKEELSEEDIASLRSLIEQADKQPAFAAYLVDTMGVEEFLRLSQRVERASADMEGDARDDATALLRNMGNVLNTAFCVPGDLQPGSEAYEDWLANTPQGQAYARRLDAFREVGTQQLGSEDESGLGFDVAFDLMGRSGIPMDEQFFTETMHYLNDPYAPGKDVCVPWPEEMSQSLLLACARTNPDATRAYLLPRPTSPELEVAWAMERIGTGEDMTELERATLAAVLRSNEDDPAFNQALLDEIGTNGLLEFNALLAEGAHGDDSAAVRQDYAQLQEGLANGIATATQDPDSAWYESFMGSLETFGGLTYEVGFTENEVRGYQLLLNLLEEGNGYSSPFLNDLGAQLRETDSNADDEFWRNYTDAAGMDGIDIDNGELDMLALDPINSLLGIMGRHPDAAADYFAPSGDNLDYLIARDWGTNLYTHYSGPSPMYIEPSPALGTDMSGFGDALVAATTGVSSATPNQIPPEHRPVHRKILNDALRQFAGTGNDFPAQLRQPFAEILVNHGVEVNQTAGGLRSAAMPLDKTALFDVVTQVSRDPDAYGYLNECMNVVIADSFDDTKAWDGERMDPSDTMHRGGRTIGFLESARKAAIYGDASDEQARNAWDARFAYHGWGGLVTFIPGVGDIAQRSVDGLTQKWLEDENNRIEAGADAATQNVSVTRNFQLERLAEHWYQVNKKWANGPEGNEYDTAGNRITQIQIGANVGRHVHEGSS